MHAATVFFTALKAQGQPVSRIEFSLGIGTAIATFFFGFAGPVFAHLWLQSSDTFSIAGLRGPLDYVSAVVGDGVALPLVNMVAVVVLRRSKAYVGKKEAAAALLSGVLVTTYFHATQATAGLVNWSMPVPWRWNAFGAWHALYMCAVASLLALFYIVTAKKIFARAFPEAVGALAVTAGLLIFFVMLRFDYLAMSLEALGPAVLWNALR